MSYHVRNIPRGTFGEFDKIMEEVIELQDSIEQDAKIMAINELADIIGAIEGYVEKHHPNITLADLIKMKDLTKNAFLSGSRISKE